MGWGRLLMFSGGWVVGNWVLVFCVLLCCAVLLCVGCGVVWCGVGWFCGGYRLVVVLLGFSIVVPTAGPQQQCIHTFECRLYEYRIQLAKSDFILRALPCRLNCSQGSVSSEDPVSFYLKTRKHQLLREKFTTLFVSTYFTDPQRM